MADSLCDANGAGKVGVELIAAKQAIQVTDVGNVKGELINAGCEQGIHAASI